MAMLAERKKKVKWSLNPRGNDWVKDNNKFGQRMLEKMGWEPGTGLGAKRQGRTEFVRIKMKNDTKGLGNKEKYDEVWTRQQQNFDNLLAKLNGSDKKGGNIDSINITSLEDRSKKSKARVHYHKFTRGKDVSKYSSKDLNGIIGVCDKHMEDSSELSPENTNSMYDYFKNKNKIVNKFINDEEMFTEISDSFDYVRTPEANDENDEPKNVNDDNVENKKGKKKAKQKASKSIENSIQDISENESVERLEMPVKKKKKKSVENNGVSANKCNDNYGIVETNLSDENINNIIDTEPLKKKKKKRHKDVDDR